MADKSKLTRAERKQIEAVIRKYRGDGKPHTAQDTIPYQIMYPDGICYLGNRRYSQSIEFFDINYLLAQPDDQTAIFEYLCDLYNYLDSSIHVQFTYPNRKSDREQLARSFEMPPAGDGLDPIRQEQTDILKRQLARGNNGSVKTKYITYTIEADNLKAARARLSKRMICPKNSPITEQTSPMKSPIAMIAPCAASQPIKKPPFVYTVIASIIV